MVPTNGTRVDSSPQEKRLEQRRQARQAAHVDRQNKDAVLIEFQPDAVEIERQSVPGGARWTLYTVVAMICASIAWSYWAKVDKIILTEGKIITSVPSILIDTKLPSPIKSINVKFGDKVVAGQVVATLDRTFSDSDVKILETKRALQYALRQRLEAERDKKPFDLKGHENDPDWLNQYQLYLQRKEAYQAKIREFEAEENKLKVTQENNTLSILFHRDNYSKFKDYEEKIRTLVGKGSSSETEMLSRKLQTNEAKMKLADVLSKELELVKEVEALITRREAFIAEERAKIMVDLVAAHEKLAEVEQEIKKAQQSNTYVDVTVPDNLDYKEFVVVEVSDNSVGNVVEPGKPLMKLIPTGVPFEVEIEIQGKDIGQIKSASQDQIQSHDYPVGSEVRIKLVSFPFQRHGTLSGVIKTISEDSFEKKQAEGIASMTYYKARVHLLESVKLENIGKEFRLMPGMATQAEIKVGNRRVIEYFLDPLIKYMKEFAREP